MLANREIVNFQKWDFFRFFYILLLLIVSLQEQEKCLLSIWFALFAANKCIKSHFVAQMCGLFSSVFKKSIPNNTTPTFQELGGVT